MRHMVLLAAASCFAASGSAAAFEFEAENPHFVVTVPNLPAMRLTAQTRADPNVSSAVAGGDGTYEVSVLSTKDEGESTARTCASKFLRALIARPGMPDRDNIYRTPLDENTFLVLYILGTRDHQQLHAYLLSSSSATHCVEAHFTRTGPDGGDDDGWRQRFIGAHIQDR